MIALSIGAAVAFVILIVAAGWAYAWLTRQYYRWKYGPRKQS